MSDVPCPCCGFLTLDEEYGSYEICPVCNWEDDGVQLANPTSGGGANGRSLAEAQAVAIAAYPVNVELARGFKRSRNWRPLSAEEIEAASARGAVKHWHSSAVLSETEAYWSAKEPKDESRI